MLKIRNKDHITLLVKPTHKCNMNCSYCYDRIYRETIKKDMSLEDVKEVAQKARGIASTVNWIWHGGEVLVLGKKWFKEASKIVREELGSFLGNINLQSNGLLIDDEWIEIFKEEQINLGVSYDGIHHNETRAENAAIIQNNIKKCKEKGMKVGVISVLTMENIKDWKKNVDHLKSLGLKKISFNIIHPDKVGSLEFSATGKDEYIKHFKEYFDYILYNQEGMIDRNIDAFILNMLGSSKCVCNYSDCTGRFIGIAPNGIIYPCDRYYPDRYELGHISEYESLSEAFTSKGYENLIYDRTKRRDFCKKNCNLSDFCYGGCNATALLYNDGVFDNVNENYCYFYKSIFKYTFEKLKDLTSDQIQSLNSHYYKLLMDNGYISLSSIKEALRGE